MNSKKLLHLFGVALLFLSATTSSLASPVKVLSIWDNIPEEIINFEQLQHVNPNAPKGGKARFGAIGTFDNFNPFSPRGLSASRISLTYETLGESVHGEDFIIHGLLAESFELAQDRSYLLVHINPQAKFNDGKPVTAHDVEFSFYALTTKANPTYRNYYASVKNAKAITEHTVRFDFADTSNRELPLIICQLPILPKHWWQDRNIGEPQKEIFPGSGPYKFKEAKVGSSVTYERDPNWWGATLPINKGRYNFDIIHVDYYRDQAIAREAFFAGETDFFAENTIKDWENSYNVPPVQSGLILRSEIPQKRPAGMSGFFLNTRKPALQDKNVRQALALMFDFEWTNKSLFYGAYTRCDSFFSNSDFAATKDLSEQEKQLLVKHQFAEEIISILPSLPVLDASGNNREQMKEAFALLAKAGWRLQNGVLKNQAGEALKLNFLLSSPSMQRIIMPYKRGLERIGIQLEIQLVDQSQYVARVREFDYDMIYSTIKQSLNPGNEQRNYWSSKAAVTLGTRNYAGVNDKKIDALIAEISQPASQKALMVATKALDRALLHGYYVIPGWYSSHMRFSHNTKHISPPEQHPEYGIDITSWYAPNLNLAKD